MPFLFKYAVDHLNNAAPLMDTVAGSAMTLTTALLLGCKFDILINDELNKLLPHAPNSPKCWIICPCLLLNIKSQYALIH